MHTPDTPSSSTDSEPETPTHFELAQNHSFRRPSGITPLAIPSIEINFAPNVTAPDTPMGGQSSSRKTSARSCTTRRFSRRVSRRLSRAMSRRGSKEQKTVAFPKKRIVKFVDPFSLPRSNSPRKYGKFLVRLFDGNFHETQIQRLSHLKGLKRKSVLTRMSQSSNMSRNSFLRVHSSSQHSSYSQNSRKTYADTASLQSEIESLIIPNCLKRGSRNTFHGRQIKRFDSIRSNASPKNSVNNQNNSIHSLSTATSISKFNIQRSKFQRTKASQFVKARSLQPPKAHDETHPPPPPQANKQQTKLQSKDDKDFLRVHQFSYSSISLAPIPSPGSRPSPKPKLKSFVNTFRRTVNSFNLPKRRLLYPNPFAKELSRRQQALESIDDKGMRFSLITQEITRPCTSLSPIAKDSNPSLLKTLRQIKKEEMAPSEELLDRFTKPTLRQLFSRLAQKNSLRVEAQDRLGFTLQRFGL